MSIDSQTLEPQVMLDKSRSILKSARSVLSVPVPNDSTFARTNAETRPDNYASFSPVIAKGKGAVITDVDGNDYVDFALNRGAIILGHADDRIVAAISKAASKGFGFSDPTETQVRLAEMIAGRFASIERVEYMRSRARALATAIRVARTATGRKNVFVVRGSVAEQVAVAIDQGSIILERDIISPYSNHNAHSHILTVDAGDTAEWQRVFVEHASSIAAVVVEPFGVSTGLIEPEPERFKTLRSLCSEHGAFLVFDDCVTGLRVGPGGAESVLGIAPDITLLGHEIGGGLPLAVLGGTKDVMKETARVAAQCAFSDAPTDDLAIAAGIAVLQAVAEAGFYEALDEHAKYFAAGVGQLTDSAGDAIDVRHVGSLVALSQSQPVGRATGSNETVTHPAYSIDALLTAGIMPPIDAAAPWSISAAHTKDDIDRALECFAVALNADCHQD